MKVEYSNREIGLKKMCRNSKTTARDFFHLLKFSNAEDNAFRFVTARIYRVYLTRTCADTFSLMHVYKCNNRHRRREGTHAVIFDTDRSELFITLLYDYVYVP